MSAPQPTHSLERTSPFGMRFLGKCVLCGRVDLTMGDALKPCPNPARITSDEAVLDAIEGSGR